MKKILIIEDTVEIAELLRDVLMKKGFSVVICHDGYQGIEFTHREKPDLILLDLMMPAGGGFYVLEKIKLSSFTKGIPVVVLTASKDSDHKAKAIEMGIDAYLEKPYDTNQLVATIQGFLSEH